MTRVFHHPLALVCAIQLLFEKQKTLCFDKNPDDLIHTASARSKDTAGHADHTCAKINVFLMINKQKKFTDLQIMRINGMIMME